MSQDERTEIGHAREQRDVAVKEADSLRAALANEQRNHDLALGILKEELAKALGQPLSRAPLVAILTSHGLGSEGSPMLQAVTELKLVPRCDRPGGCRLGDLEIVREGKRRFTYCRVHKERSECDVSGKARLVGVCYVERIEVVQK